jgi:hypothetical protein
VRLPKRDKPRARFLIVIPAQAGIQNKFFLGPRLREGDERVMRGESFEPQRR